MVTAWKLGRGNLGKIPDVLFLLYIFHVLLLDCLPGRIVGLNINELLPPCQDSDSQARRIEYCANSSHSAKDTAYDDKEIRPRCFESTQRGHAECAPGESLRASSRLEDH